MELQILLRPISIPLVKYFQEDTHSPCFVLRDISHDSHVTKKPTPRTNEVQSDSDYATFS